MRTSSRSSVLTSALAALIVGVGFGLARGLATMTVRDGVIQAVVFGLMGGVVIEIVQRGSARAGTIWTSRRRRRLILGLTLGTLVGATLSGVLYRILDA